LEKWREERRGAFMGFVGSALITWAIWVAINWTEWSHAFPWPLIVNAFALMNFIRVVAGKTDIVTSEVKRLERKRAKEIEAQNQKRQLGQ
jgi:CDP-diglyceride synthetase